MDRYKQLLLKQRDIMIALTQRLNERDEQIMALQVGVTVPLMHRPLITSIMLPSFFNLLVMSFFVSPLSLLSLPPSQDELDAYDRHQKQLEEKLAR